MQRQRFSRLVALVVTTIVLLSPNAHAASALAVEAATTAYTPEMNAEATRQVVDMLVRSAEAQKGKKMPPSMKNELAEAVAAANSRAFVIGVAAEVYDEYLSQRDLRAILEFFGTETGKKWIRLSATLAKETTTRATPELERRMQNEFAKRGIR